MTNDLLHSAAQLRASLRSIDEDRTASIRAAEQQHARNSGALLRDAIARVEAMEAELAEARAELEDANDHKPDTLNAAAIVYDLEARGLWTVKPDDVPTRDYAKKALRTVLDGVDVVLGRVADVGGMVEVPVPVPDRTIAEALRAFLVAVDMWEDDMRTRPEMRPTEVIRETYARMREARMSALNALGRASVPVPMLAADEALADKPDT